MRKHWLLIISITTIMALQGIKARGDDKSSVLDKLKFVQGDEDGNEKKAAKAELLVSYSESKAVAQIQKLIQKYRGTPLEPDLQFRLAELYMRRSKTDRFFEIHRETENVVKLAPRVAKTASSRSSLNLAVQVYNYIEKKFPGYGQMDLVIFNHAFAEQALGQDKDAEKLYWELVQKFQDSPLVPDAHLAIGEIAFQRADFVKALEHFDAIRKFPESRVYPYGIYKAAWAHYNLRDAVAGLKNLEEVVAYGNKVQEEHLDSKLDLRKEALADMTLFCEDVFPSKEAYSYFRKQAKEEELSDILMKLANLYERHGRYQDQRVVLTDVLEHIDNTPLTPDIMNRMAMAADALKKKDMAVQDMQNFQKVCEMGSSFVKAHPDKGVECLDTLHKTSLLLAERWLRIWNKNPYEPSFSETSEQAFRVYLHFKKTDEEYAKAHFLYAELLFKREKYREASQEYATIGTAAGPQIGHDASYAACLSLEKAVGEKWSDKDEQSFHVLGNAYLANYPKGKYRLEVQFKMAFLAYEKGRYDEASPMFKQIGHEYAKEEKGQKAQDLYLDILNIKKDYAGIRSYSAEQRKGTKDPVRVAKFTQLYEQAYFFQIQQIEEKGDLTAAVKQYQEFTKDNPHSELAEKAYWNTAQLMYKTGDGFQGANALLEFATHFPNSPQVQPALEKAAQTLEQMAQLKPAGDVLLKLANYDKSKAAKWKELAADFYALSGHPEMARSIYQGLIVATAASAEKERLLHRLENFEKNYGDEVTHSEALRELVQKGIAPEAHEVQIKKLQARFDSGDYPETFQQSKRLLGESDFSAGEKAQVRLIQAQVLEDEFVRQSVKARPERLAMVLGMKTEKLGKAEQAYQSVIRFGDPKTALQALEHLHSCFAQYVMALKGLPSPEGMTPPEEKAFRQELGSLIMPLEDKGVETLGQALAFAKKNHLLEAIPRLETELAKANLLPEPQHVAVNEPNMVVPVEERRMP